MTCELWMKPAEPSPEQLKRFWDMVEQLKAIPTDIPYWQYMEQHNRIYSSFKATAAAPAQPTDQASE